MKKWVLKAIVQKVISFLPASHRINFWFQKYVTKGVQLSDSYLGDKLMHAHDHLRFQAEVGGLTGKRSLELGTGWYPVVPVAFYLAGAERVVSVDLSPLMSKEAVANTIKKFQEWINQGKLDHFKPYWQADRISALLALDPHAFDFSTLLQKIHLDYRVEDAQNLRDEDNSFDLIHSNNVYEHIYPEILENILKEFKRVLKPTGRMSHFIDMSDHFAHLDPSISIYNFLQFSESAWRRIDNSVQPQNRCRLSDYEALYQKLDFNIVIKEQRDGEPEALAQLDLAPPFKERSIQSLAVSHVHLVNVI